MAEFGNRKLQWLGSLGLNLGNGVSSHDAFNHVFASLDPRAIRDCFHGWICSICDAVGVRDVPIDRKAARGHSGRGTWLLPLAPDRRRL
jgi:hypothetical protein